MNDPRQENAAAAYRKDLEHDLDGLEPSMEKELKVESNPLPAMADTLISVLTSHDDENGREPSEGAAK